MIKALVYVHIDCPVCGDSTIPFQAWVIEGGYDEDGHAHELEVDLIECAQCGDLAESCELEALDAIADEILDAVCAGRTYPIGEVLSYYREREAGKVLGYWMNTFSERHPEES